MVERGIHNLSVANAFSCHRKPLGIVRSINDSLKVIIGVPRKIVTTDNSGLQTFAFVIRISVRCDFVNVRLYL